MKTLYVLLGLTLIVPSLPAAVSPFVPHSPEDSLVRYLDRNNLDKSDEPYVLPSQVYTEQATPAARRGLIKQLLKGVVNAIPASGLTQLIEASFGWKIGDPHEAQLLMSGDEGALDRAAAYLIDHLQLEKDPTPLDRFPSIPLSAMTSLQETALSYGKYNPSPGAPLAFAATYPGDWNHVDLRSSGCTAPQRRALTPVFPDYGISTGAALVHKELAPCYAENSTALAQLFNGMSNEVAGQTLEGTLLFAGSHPSTVHSMADLARAVGEQGLTLELYDSRVPVDFLSWWIKDSHGRARSLRVATWFLVKLGNQTIQVPAEHGEIDLLVRRTDGKRVAGLRWFFGIPDSSLPGSAAYFRPHLFLAVSWSKPLHEFVNVYPPERTADAGAYLEAAAYSMRGFRAIQDRYQPPFNGYGLFICSDSLAMGLATLNDRQGITPSGRLTDAFPIVYARELHRANAIAHLDRLFARYSGARLDTLSRFAPTDEALEADSDAMKSRLQRAFPAEADTRLAPFPEFLAGGLKKIRE